MRKRQQSKRFRKPGKHEVRVKEVSYMVDQAFCSCGWESSRYFDGAEYAHDEWKNHVSKEA